MDDDIYGKYRIYLEKSVAIMSEFGPHENELSSASSRSTESLEENIRKILTVVESKGHVLLDK